MFEKTSLKLAGVYLAIMMLISIFFSMNLYRLSIQEFDREYARQGNFLKRVANIPFLQNEHNRLLTQREQQYEEAKSHIVGNLVFTNAVILIFSGGLSYYLARRTLQPIEEAHESLERFTADASHELRTPIAAMQTEIEVALMNPQLKLDDTKVLLRSNLEELAKLTALSDGLLRLARLEGNELEHIPVRLQPIVQKAIDHILPAAEKKHILIHTPQSTNLEVSGDEHSLVEALVIVLENAVKYSHEKSEVHIHIRKEQRNVIVAVKDTGIGISAAELPHIFERFYRADAARSKQHIKGYGLGLAIAKNIVELHDGSIAADSKPGKGTTMTIRLPLK